jgi:hypothetical protein
MRLLIAVLFCLLAIPSAQGQTPMSIPDDFPHFRVPGQEKEMETLRALFWLHYPGAGPKATLWDEWLPAPSLWPAVSTNNMADSFRKQWSDVLSARILDPEGYVATHQHPSIAHPLGWPFPFWNQGQGGAGWHFSFLNTVGPPWRQANLNTPDGWTLDGAEAQGVGEFGWDLRLTAPGASATTPIQPIDTFQAPFLQLRWKFPGLAGAQPYVEWATKEDPRFGPDRRVYFERTEGETGQYTVIAMYHHPKWKGEVNQLRIGFGNVKPGGAVSLQAFFTQYDTRHNINGQNFIRGCAHYFRWTRDLDFLSKNINRMRTALRYLMTEHEALKRKVVYTGWVGHDGRSGLQRNPDGTKKLLFGHGIGNNYWDLLPFGSLDAYATVQYYDAVLAMAAVERDVRAHPEWSVPGGVFSFDPAMLEKHAAEVKAEGNRLFWNPKTGRFAACVDADGMTHDYGFTFLNFEAVYYDFATPAHAREIMKWLCGERMVEGDTAQGPDIYHWRFAPRATTKRNVEWYLWAWSAPETIPWGGQVQDGGAVLGFSYHDLMARMKTRGPDDAWKRLQEILRWFDEAQAAGGYRKYYDGSREGTLQGGGTAGGLGMDQEFFESVLVPQVMLRGFLGFSPASDGFRLDPRLPADWPELTVDRIRWHDLTLRVRATRDAVEVWKAGRPEEPCFVRLPKGEWKAVALNADGSEGAPVALKTRSSDGALELDWKDAAGVRFERAAAGKL